MRPTPAVILACLRDFPSRVGALFELNTASCNAEESPTSPTSATEPSEQTGSADVSTQFSPINPAALESLADVVTHAGLTPAEFVTSILADHGGELQQQAFADMTAWSCSTDSRLIQQLEDDEIIVRVQIGREKTMYLPEAAPSDAFSWGQ